MLALATTAAFTLDSASPSALASAACSTAAAAFFKAACAAVRADSAASFEGERKQAMTSVGEEGSNGEEGSDGEEGSLWLRFTPFSSFDFWSGRAAAAAWFNFLATR